MNVNNIQQINFNPKSSLKSLNSSIINRYTTTYAIKKGYFNLVRFFYLVKKKHFYLIKNLGITRSGQRRVNA